LLQANPDAPISISLWISRDDVDKLFRPDIHFVNEGTFSFTIPEDGSETGKKAGSR
jgi:hypothetical protein